MMMRRVCTSKSAVRVIYTGDRKLCEVPVSGGYVFVISLPYMDFVEGQGLSRTLRVRLGRVPSSARHQSIIL